MSLLVAEDIAVTFRSGRQALRAVDGVDVAIDEGEIVGLVGESGSGKSTLARALLGLVPLARGTVTLDGTVISGLDDAAMRPHRRALQMVFQDPYGALNPRRSVGATLVEALAFHRVVERDRLDAHARALIERVHLPAATFDRFPHELSGGQRQRIGIARAICVAPRVVVADEPVSALDVSVRAQILTLLGELSSELGLAYLFITHDLTVVEHFAHRVLVMYLGRVVEALPARTARSDARHPYTKALFEAVPSLDPSRRRLNRPIVGDVPSPVDVPSGCAFSTRCPIAEPSCAKTRPELVQIAEAHRVACPVVA